MAEDAGIGSRLADLKALAPGGFAIALHIHYMTPRFLFQSYPKSWIDRYSQKGYVLRDPTVRWGFENTGIVRWEDLAALDEDGMLAEAAAYGMVYGVTYALGPETRRTIASFARGDRPFGEDEIEDMMREVDSIAAATDEQSLIDSDVRNALRRLSVEVTHPGR